MDASPAPPSPEPQPERDREAEMRNVVGGLVDDIEFARLYLNNAIFYNAMNLAAQRLAPAPPSPEPGEAERLLRGLVESLEAAGLTPHMVTDARLPAVRHYNQTRKTAVAWLAARPRPEEADPA